MSVERNLEINSEIKDILKENNIKYEDGLSFLISLYFDCIPTYCPDIFKMKMLQTNIFTMDRENNPTWEVSLFYEQVTGFEWVKEFRDAFKAINPDRAGVLATCISRFKRFFAKYPKYRVEDIKDATNMYFRSLSSPEYLKTSQRFIWDGPQTTGSSELLMWLERLEESRSEGRTSKTNTMK